MNKKDNLFIRVLSLILCLTILPINVFAINQSEGEYKTDEVISERIDDIEQDLDDMELYYNNDTQQTLGSSTSVSILPTDDTYVHGSSVNTNYGEDQKVVILNGRNTTTGKATGRFAFFKYDLNDSSIPNGSITSASIKLTRTSGGGSTPLIFGLVEDTVFSQNWSEDTLTYKEVNEVGIEPFESKKILTAQTPSKTGEEYALNYDITLGAQIVQNISDYDGKLTLVVFFGPRADGTFSPVGCDLATKENTNESIRPYLTLEINDDTDLGNAIKDKVWIDEQIPMEVTENLLLPTIGQNGSEISWGSSDTSAIEENGDVTRPSNQEGDKAVVLTATISNGEQSIMHEFEVLVKALPMTDEEKVFADMNYIKSKLDRLTVIIDIQFPESIELPYQSSIIYVSSDPEHLGDDGAVTRPGVEEPSATVTLTVKVENGSAMGIEYITIYVQKQLMSMNEYIKEDLGNILDAAKELITRPNHIQEQIIIEPEQLTDTSNMPTGSVVGDKWGQYPQEAVDKFQSVINNAQIVYDTHQNEENVYYLSSNDLIQAGIDFIKSANIDDSVLVRNQQDHKLLFSAYRRDLMAYVWEAETLLMLEPYFYPKSAKLALQKYIDEAKEALDYTHKFPFVRSRGFIVPREDEHIRQATERFARRLTERSALSRVDGISTQINLYKSQHILFDAYETVKLIPTDDTYINELSPSTNYGKDINLQPGNGRSDSSVGGAPTHTTFIKFDLSPYRDWRILGADFNIWQYKTGNAVRTNFYSLTDPGLFDWNEDSFTYNEYISNKTYSGITDNRFITQLRITGSNDIENGNKYSFVAYDVIKESIRKNEDELTIIMYTPSKEEDAAVIDNRRKDYKSKDWGERADGAGNGPYPDQVPCLELKINNPTVENLQAKYDFVISKANILLEKTKDGENVGNAVGNYPAEYVSMLINAIDEANLQMQLGDANKLGIALVAVYDAMRDMRDNQVMRTNVDPNSNLFFTSEEKLEIVKKITAIPNLAQFYSDKKASADQKTLSKYLDEFILMNPAMSYNEFNSVFNGFSNKARGEMNPVTPNNAKYASLEIVLPSDNNTEDAVVFNTEAQKYANGVNPAMRVGHIWIDNITLNDPNGFSVVGETNNFNFERISSNGMPENWEFTSNKGTPKFDLESRRNYVNSGSYSVRIENPTNSDEAVLKYYKDKEQYVMVDDSKNYIFDVMSGTTLTLDFNVKQDGFLAGFDSEIQNIFNETGTEVNIRFYDENKNYISTDTYRLNKKSGSSSRHNQGDALAYMVTRDPVYAQKIKLGLLNGANDFCQGAESWIVTNQRPYDIDSYGAVQAGRYLVIASSIYAMIEDANVFTEDEFEQFRKMMQYIVDYCINIQDQTVYDDSMIDNTINWETDMYSGAAAAAMALRELDADNPGNMRSVIDGSKQVIDNASWLLKGQMERNIPDTGAYSESIRYMWASYSRVTTIAKAMFNNLNDNWFENTKLPLIFEFAVQVQTPPLRYLNNRVSVPNYGSNTIGGGPQGMVLLGQYYEDIAESDVTLGAQVLETWKRAGMPIGVDNEGAMISAFFVPADIKNHLNIPLDLVSTDFYHQMSPVIMRNNQGRENETGIVVLSSTEIMNHTHRDEGSFMLMSRGSYLVVDMGIENYFDRATKEQYESSSNHSTLTFYTNNEDIIYSGNVSKDDEGRDVINTTISRNHIKTSNTPQVSELKVSDYSDSLDFVKIKIAPGIGGEEHYRNIAYVKEGLDAVIVWDQVENNTQITQFNIPTAAKETIINGNRVKTVGHYEMDMETSVLLPKDVGVVYDRIRCISVAPTLEGYDYPTVDVIRAIAKQPGENHLTVLYPMEKGRQGLEITEISTDNSNVAVYNIKSPDGYSVVIAANNSGKSQSIELGDNLVDLQTGDSYNGYIPSDTMLVLRDASLSEPIPAKVEITGPKIVQKPNTNKGLTYNYNGILVDQYNNKMTGLNKTLDINQYILPSRDLPKTGEPKDLTIDSIFKSPHPMTIGVPNISWSINPAVDGASIDKNGILTIDEDIRVKRITLVAESNGIKSNYEVSVGDVMIGYPDRLEIDGATTIGLSQDEEVLSQYNYKVYDQFGVQMSVSDIIWNFSSTDITGISIDKSGLLKITAEAVNEMISNDITVITITAHSSTNSKLKDIKSVVLEMSKPSAIKTNIPSEIQVPISEAKTIKFDADIVNQNGEILSGVGAMIWGISGSNIPNGLTIDKDTGELTVPSEIGEVDFEIEITANISDGSIIKELIPVSTTVNRVTYNLSIEGDKTITASESMQIKTYSIRAYDLYNDEISNPSVTWSIDNSLYGVAFNSKTATLSVQDFAEAGKITLTALTDDGIEAFIEITINKKPVSGNVGPGTPNSGGGGGGNIGGSVGNIPETVEPNEPALLFSDVQRTFWGYEYIQKLAVEGKIKGADGLFRPEAYVTRAEFVQMIANILGLAEVKKTASFIDVNTDDWFYKSVSIANDKGFVLGYEDGTYRPNDNITRQDMAVIIKRVVDYKNIELNTETEKRLFDDEQSKAEYAKDAIELMQRAGIITGYDDNTFRPLNNATRAEAAKILYYINLEK